MQRHEIIDTSRDPDVAFAYVADFTNAPAWDPSTVSARRVDDGPLGVGSRFALVVRFLGRDVPLEYRVVDFDPPTRVVFDVSSDRGVTGCDDIRIEAGPSGSRLHYEARVRVGGLAGRLLDPVLGLVFRRMASAAADGLRAELS